MADEKCRARVPANLRRLWDMIPEIDCKMKCAASCGPVTCGAAELRSIREYCRANGIPYHRLPTTGREAWKVIREKSKDLPPEYLTSDTPAPCMACPYLRDGRCSIHPVRPALCRIWGTVPEMPCAFGCRPRSAISNAKGRRIMAKVFGLP